MKTVFFKDEGYEILGNKHKWALSTEEMDEEIWFGNTVQQAWDNLCMDKYNRLIPAKFVSMIELAESKDVKIDRQAAVDVLNYIQKRTDTLICNQDVYNYSKVGSLMISKIENKAFDLSSTLESKEDKPMSQKEYEDFHKFAEFIEFILKTTGWDSQKTINEIKTWVWEVKQVIAGKSSQEIDEEFIKKYLSPTKARTI